VAWRFLLLPVRIDGSQAFVQQVLSQDKCEERYNTEEYKINYEENDLGLNDSQFFGKFLPSLEKFLEKSFHQSFFFSCQGRMYREDPSPRG
jgi:hypothetical protein